MSSDSTALSAEAIEIEAKLKRQIMNFIIANGGEISFSEFVRQALYEPGLGYYQNQLQTFGEQGDFITAPEMGDRFATCIGNALLSVAPELRCHLLEVGAGSGALAVSLLRHLASLDAVPETYFILEPSAYLQAQQRKALQQHLPELASRVSWLSQLPTDFCGVMFANEVADALPFERITLAQGQWHYANVCLSPKDDDISTESDVEFRWSLGEPVSEAALPAGLNASHTYTDGYCSELRPLIKPWVQSLANSLQTGHLLLFDYGYPQAEYYHPQRLSGSLKCFSRHTANNDPLVLVGLQDITAHVDFTDLALSAHQAGFKVEGYTTQAGFLLANGLLDINSEAGQRQRYQASQEIQKLTAPGQMGEIIKAMSFSKGLKPEVSSSISGFSLQDHLHRL